MNAVIKASVGLVVVVALVSILMIVTGIHANPLGGMASVVLFIVFNLGAVFWALKQTAKDNGYGPQLINGVLIGAIAGVLIFLTSWVTLSFIFPDAIQQQIDGTLAFLESAGMSDEQIDTTMQSVEATTPMSSAMQGLIGTFGTSVVGAAIIAIFLRKK
jgi:hypothetical protein